MKKFNAFLILLNIVCFILKKILKAEYNIKKYIKSKEVFLISVLSRLKKGVITFGLVTALATTAAGPVFASEVTEATNSFEVSVNDIIDGVDGKEKVISVFNDGRYVTTSLKDTEVFATCPHTNIVGMGTKHQVTSSYNKSDSTYCYKYRYYEDARCAQCGKQGYKIYDKSWTKVKHKYKLFGDTCTVCGYVK